MSDVRIVRWQVPGPSGDWHCQTPAKTRTATDWDLPAEPAQHGTTATKWRPFHNVHGRRYRFHLCHRCLCRRGKHTEPCSPHLGKRNSVITWLGKCHPISCRCIGYVRYIITSRRVVELTHSPTYNSWAGQVIYPIVKAAKNWKRSYHKHHIQKLKYQEKLHAEELNNLSLASKIWVIKPRTKSGMAHLRFRNNIKLLLIGKLKRRHRLVNLSVD